MQLYDIRAYNKRSAKPLAAMDFNRPLRDDHRAAPGQVDYARNTNWDGHVLWIDDHGRVYNSRDELERAYPAFVVQRALDTMSEEHCATKEDYQAAQRELTHRPLMDRTPFAVWVLARIAQGQRIMRKAEKR